MSDETTTPLNPISDYNTNSSKANINSAINYFQDSLNYAYSRIPNMAEVLLNSGPKAFTDIILGTFILNFGENPTAASFVRDIIKTPGSIAVAYHQTEIGSTGIKHDEGSLCALFGRLGCKVSFISAGYTLGFDQETSGRISNYPCDSLSRYFYIVSRERQALIKENLELNKISYHKFLTNNFKFSWVLESIGEGIIKTTVADFASENLIKRIGYQPYIRDLTNNIEKNLAKYIFQEDIAFGNKDDIWHKISAYSNVFKSEGVTNYGKVAIASCYTFAIDVLGKFASEVTSASLLMPLTRISQDVTGKVIRETVNYFNSTGENLHEEMAGLVESDSEL